VGISRASVGSGGSGSGLRRRQRGCGGGGAFGNLVSQGVGVSLCCCCSQDVIPSYPNVRDGSVLGSRCRKYAISGMTMSSTKQSQHQNPISCLPNGLRGESGEVARGLEDSNLSRRDRLRKAWYRKSSSSKTARGCRTGGAGVGGKVGGWPRWERRAHAEQSRASPTTTMPGRCAARCVRCAARCV